MLLTPSMDETEVTAGKLTAMNGVSEPNTKPGMKYILKGLKALKELDQKVSLIWNIKN